MTRDRHRHPPGAKHNLPLDDDGRIIPPDELEGFTQRPVEDDTGREPIRTRRGPVSMFDEGAAHDAGRARMRVVENRRASYYRRRL